MHFRILEAIQVQKQIAKVVLHFGIGKRCRSAARIGLDRILGCYLHRRPRTALSYVFADFGLDSSLVGLKSFRKTGVRRIAFRKSSDEINELHPALAVCTEEKV